MNYDLLKTRYRKDKIKIDKGEFIYDSDYFIMTNKEISQENVLNMHFMKRYSSFLHEPILDFGCGVGIFLLACKSQGYKEIIGVDISDDALRICQKEGLSDLLLYRSKEHLNIVKDKTIGTIYNNQVIEHIPRGESDTLLREFFRILKPNGNMILTFPAENDKINNPDPTHINFYKIDDFLRYIKSIGFEIKYFWSLLYIPVYQNYVMQIDHIFQNTTPIINRLIYAFRKYAYIMLKKIFKNTPGTSIFVVAIKKGG